MFRVQKKEAQLMLSKHVQEPIIILIRWYSWMDWPTTDWLRPFLTDLFPHSEKCKMGKDEHFGSERRLTLSPCFFLLSEKWMREREHSKEISRTRKKPICPKSPGFWTEKKGKTDLLIDHRCELPHPLPVPATSLWSTTRYIGREPAKVTL